jgi:hypothetical protein
MNNKTKKILSIGFLSLIVVIIVVIIPVIIGVTGKPKDFPKTTTKAPTSPTKKPFNPDVLSFEQKSRINCFLEEESRFENLTKYQCETVRGCIYDPSEYDRVPNCYFNREKLGYELDQVVDESDTKSEYILKRSTNVQAPYLEEIQNLRLVVEYLENNIVHVKV